MKWTESYNLIEIDEGDYGTKISFDAIDFLVGDIIVVVFQNNIIEPKIYTVTNKTYTFNLSFSKEEIENIDVGDYKYSIKQYRNNEFIDTLVNGILRIKESVKWQH